MVKSLPLVIHKEAPLLPQDRTAEGTPKHVPAYWRTRNLRRIRVDLVFPLICVQFIVPEELPDVAVEAVCSGFDGGADDATFEIAELRRSIVADQVEFLNRVRRRRVPEEVVGYLVIVQTVQQEVVGLFAIPI